MVKLETIATKRAVELQPPPKRGNPYAVALPGSKIEGRSEVYRHWRFADGLLETLDPNASLFVHSRKAMLMRY
jgi:long-chain acyl-CoA synthetase